MILNTKPENIASQTTSNVVSSFTIRTTAKAFQILSSGLYADKIKAIVRELSCNAFDSHIAAGRGDIPFETHLPNAMEPWFSIKDYGVGLSQADVINVYTTYFESTKTDSNDYVGALGLGSKSPFSYTDTFTVSAIKNGLCSLYSAFINDQGVPSIALLTEFETVEPNGVEVKLAVENSRDMTKFRTAAIDVYRWFKIPPKVSGWSEFGAELEKLKAVWNIQSLDVSMPDVRLTNVVANPHHSTFYNVTQTETLAIMGNIAYPIQIPNIQQNIKEKFHYFLSMRRLVLEFPIGELEFQASREGLSYTPATIAAINKKLGQIYAKQYDLFSLQIAKQDVSEWDFAGFLTQSRADTFWKPCTDRWISEHPDNPWWMNSAHAARPRGHILNMGDMAACNIVFRNRKGHGETSIYPAAEHNTVIINDGKTGGLNKIKQWLASREHKFRHGIVYLLERLDKTKPMDLETFFTEHIPDPRTSKNGILRNIEDLGLPVAAPRTKQKPRAIRAMVAMADKRHTVAARSYKWADLAHDDETYLSGTDRVCYVKLKGFEVVSEDQTHTQFKGQQFYGPLTTNVINGIIANIRIYGIRQSVWERVAELPNWIPFEQYITEQVTKLFEFSKYQMIVSVDHYHQWLKFQQKITPQQLSRLRPESSFRKQIELVSDTRQKIVQVAPTSIGREWPLTLITTLFEMLLPEKSKELQHFRDAELPNLFRGINSIYPMLSHITQTYLYPEAISDILDYINMIDVTQTTQTKPNLGVK